MVGIIGSSWTFNEPLTTITWGTTKSIPADKVGDIRSALQVDVEATRLPADDPYFGGKQMAVFARLSLIADEIGEKELAQKARDKVKPYIEGWLQGTNGDKLVYDQVNTTDLYSYFARRIKYHSNQSSPIDTPNHFFHALDMGRSCYDKWNKRQKC